MKTNPEFIYQTLIQMFPNAKCELNYRNPFELLVAVCLSAQTTDKAVNKVTPALFDKYPSSYEMAQANINDVSTFIKSIGLYHNKAKNIIEASKTIEEKFNGNVPNTREELMTLSGVGRKSANVIISECFHQNAIAVDTHVERVSKRLGLAKKDDSVLQVEQKLMKKFPKENWHQLHHLLIFFGRYHCESRNPKCNECPLKDYCTNK